MLSLLELSAGSVVEDRHLIEGRLEFLPRPVLREILVACVRRSRFLCLKTLISCWPLEQILLRECRELDEATAVLLAYYLQRVKHKLRVLDIRGCEIGTGTFIFRFVPVPLPSLKRG